MNQLKALLDKLTLKQKISILTAAVLLAGGLFWLTRWQKERDYKPLYTNLSSEDAGAIVAKLKESAVEYRVGDNGTTILVPSARVDELRLVVAAAGLPKTGRIGYELFDKTNFGATDFAEHVNYHRALEGEIERSMSALSEVERARVHLTLAKDSLFLDQRQPAKASVMLKLKPGAHLSPQNVLAVTHLVSSAVEGLAPEAVSVVDFQGNLLNRPRTGGVEGLESSDAAIEYRQRLEKDLLAKINNTLEPVLGAGKFKAGVNVDCDFTTGEQSEESFDPARSVMVTSQKTEDVMNGGGTGGVPGSASNLARPPARQSSNYGTTRRTESIAYQSSRTVRRVKLPQGGVKRMSISVLVDQAMRWEGVGPKAKRIFDPPAPEKMKVIKDLVTGVTGLVAERGDMLIVETLPFESNLSVEPPPAPEVKGKPVAPVAGFAIPIPGLEKLPPAALYGIAGAVVLIVLLLIFLWLKRKKKRTKMAAELAAKELQSAATPSGDTVGDSLQKQLEQRLAEQQQQRELEAQEVLASLKLPPVRTKKTEILIKQIGEESKKDPQSMAHVLGGWINEGKQQ